MTAFGFVAALLSVAVLSEASIFCPSTGRPERCTLDDLPHPVPPSPALEVPREGFPSSWDWNAVNGSVYTSLDLNQHIPTYCGSCWAHSALSSLADRLKISSHNQRRDVLPSVQALINCGAAGSCHGGDMITAYQWIHDNGGIPDATCQAYVAADLQNKSACGQLDGIAWCKTCAPVRVPSGFRSQCAAVPRGEYQLVKVLQYGLVNTTEQIMAEVHQRGPVACHINSTCLHPYKGGVLDYECAGHNHGISLVGWGQDGEQDYWLIRNSWGRYFGEDGWVRIRRSGPGSWDPSEFGCAWGVPSIEKS